MGNSQVCTDPVPKASWGQGAPTAFQPLPHKNANRFRSIKHQLWNMSGEFLGFPCDQGFHSCDLFLGQAAKICSFLFHKKSHFQNKTKTPKPHQSGSMHQQVDTMGHCQKEHELSKSSLTSLRPLSVPLQASKFMHMHIDPEVFASSEEGFCFLWASPTGLCHFPPNPASQSFTFLETTNACT